MRSILNFSRQCSKREKVCEAAAIEEVAFGVQKAVGIQAYLHIVLVQKGDQVLDCAQGLLVEVRACFAQARF